MSSSDSSSNPILRRLGVSIDAGGRYSGGRSGKDGYAEGFVDMICEVVCQSTDEPLHQFIGSKEKGIVTSFEDPCTCCGDTSGRQVFKLKPPLPREWKRQNQPRLRICDRELLWLNSVTQACAVWHKLAAL